MARVSRNVSIPYVTRAITLASVGRMMSMAGAFMAAASL